MGSLDAALSKVPGRVVARRGDALTVEFEPDALPRPGAWLASPRGTWAEVAHKQNQSEVLAWVRAGSAPSEGEVLRELTRDEPGCLGLALDVWSTSGPQWPRWGVPSELASLLSPPAQAQLPFAPPSTLWATGHAGLDLLVPLAWGGSLALTGDDAQGLGRVASKVLRGLCASAPCPTPPQVLVLAASGARPWWELALVGSPAALALLQPPPDAGPGALALAWRALWTVARQASERGAPLLVVLDDPSPFVAAWRATDGQARSSRAAAQYEALVCALPSPHGAGCTLLALHPEDPTAPPLPGAGGWLPTGSFWGEARFGGDRLEPENSATSLSLPDDHARQRDAALLALSGREPLEHHAAIFGADELDDDLAQDWRDHAARSAQLCELGEDPL